MRSFSSCKLSIYDVVDNSNFVIGEVKVELRIIESCSSRFNFSSGSNLDNDISSTLLEIPLST